MIHGVGARLLVRKGLPARPRPRGGFPFVRVTLAAPALEGAWLGTGDSCEARHYDSGGALTRVVRGAGPARPVTAEDRDAYVAEEVAGTSTENEARQLRALLAEMPFPVKSLTLWRLRRS